LFVASKAEICGSLSGNVLDMMNVDIAKRFASVALIHHLFALAIR
jgi:hypothetical protein